MYLLFLLFAISLIAGWYAWAIRPVNRPLSNRLLAGAATLLLLLIAGFTRLI